jgi:hypothetical protein
MTILLPNLAIAGYRSFGPSPQYFDNFSKINLFIGRNNAGKSNVIQFIREFYPTQSNPTAKKGDLTVKHIPAECSRSIGIGEKIFQDESNREYIRADHPILLEIQDTNLRSIAQMLLARLFRQKLENDKSSLCWFLYNDSGVLQESESWRNAIQALRHDDASHLWSILTGYHGGDRQSQLAAIFNYLKPSFSRLQIEVIPAIREIGAKGTSSDHHDGKGIIERLAKLQNPEALSQDDRKRFRDINAFLKSVTDDPTAEIEVPYNRDTLNVHMDGKILPIQSLGTGIHEVVMLAVATTVLTNHVVCVEEPELHLNPILQKKLMRYLTEHTTNQYFISTHSAALMDTLGAEIYHIRLEKGQSKVERVTSDSKRSMVCEDLGYHPSDLLQANCVIWVEGPSDRVYLNWWLRAKNPNLVEGIQYQIMFYGGKLASHFTYDETPADIDDFIKLRQLNRRGVMILDSDRSTKDDAINVTKQRLEKEFSKAPGHAWITAGREIENYIPTDQIKEALAAVCKTATPTSNFGQFRNTLKIKTQKGKNTQAPKVDIARYIVSKHDPDFSNLDLNERIDAIVKFIDESNPGIEVSK